MKTEKLIGGVREKEDAKKIIDDFLGEGHVPYEDQENRKKDLMDAFLRRDLTQREEEEFLRFMLPDKRQGKPFKTIEDLRKFIKDCEEKGVFEGIKREEPPTKEQMQALVESFFTERESNE